MNTTLKLNEECVLFVFEVFDYEKKLIDKEQQIRSLSEDLRATRVTLQSKEGKLQWCLAYIPCELALFIACVYLH